MARSLTHNVCTIPPDASFIGALAEGLWQKTRDGEFALADCRILLPTRRACLHLREAFLRRMESGAALLPRMQPLGDIDEEEFFFADAGIDPNIPPAIGPLRRALLLSRLIRARDPDMPLDQAAQLAEALGGFLDEAQIARCDFAKLGTLVERRDLAEHWKETVQFLEILTKNWPTLLTEEKAIDAADRRNRVLERQAEAWRNNPPPYPVIAAGSTGSIPATAELLSVIAGMPKGCVILPGLDQAMEEEAWQKVEEAHPQYAMKSLLQTFGIGRKDVKPWPGVCAPSPRVRLIEESMRPAEATEGWQKLKPADIPRDALKGLSLVALDHPQEEAQAIALMMREALETPDKTCALVTPDRSLAERVSALLARWGIAANDSGGTSLATRPVGGFLIGVLDAAAPNAGAVEILSLLKHPFAARGMAPELCRSRARQIELYIWRNRRTDDNALLVESEQWRQEFTALCRDVTTSWKRKLPLAERLAAHIALSERIAATDKNKGTARLWDKDEGEAAAEWLADLREAAHDFPHLDGEEYRNLFAGLARNVTVRPVYGQHPRVSILGPLEARLIQADRMIVGGLNESVWPPEASTDPWMSRPMKRDFGLPVPEHRVGLSAHDFVQFACAPEVILTRAKRAGNAPTVPSRFLLQLETVLRGLGYELGTPAPWQDWARALDDPQAPPQPCAAPSPRPPVAARPKKLSVTEIGLWQRNPYAIYARHVLGLAPLDPLDAEIDAADRGSLIHKALETFLKQFPDALPPNAEDALIAIGREVFAAYKEHPEARAFWWPRFLRIAEWFTANESHRRSEGARVVAAEAKGHMALGPFTLEGRADRIDRLADGTLAIVDYKTGGVPTKDEILQGIEPQLALLALIAAEGGFEKIKAAPASELAHWKLSGGRGGESILPVTGDIDGLAEQAREGLRRLIAAFADPATPYEAMPKPGTRPRYDDYAHLARLAEWGRTLEER